MGSLPHRQLRNGSANNKDVFLGSLPHRQLRKSDAIVTFVE